MLISLIVAADEKNCIGGQNKLLWSLPDDLKRFRSLTEKHAIVMGRKTYESIGRPLPKRRNIVITRSDDWSAERVEVVHSLDEALELCEGEKEVFLIGGGEIYSQAIGKADRIYLTRVHGTFEGDVFFPTIDLNQWKEVRKEAHGKDERHEYAFTFIDYERR